MRQDSWERHVWPAPLAQVFHARGVLIMPAISVFFAALSGRVPAEGQEGFYAYLSHNAMVAIFAPAFLLPLVGVAVGLRRYWHETGGGASLGRI